MLFVLLCCCVLGASGMQTLVPQTFRLDRKGEVDPRGELKIENYRVGPFQLKSHGAFEGRNIVLDRPALDSTIEVAHYGDFVPTFTNGTEIPRSQFYLHHILAYSTHSNGFVCGCSNERANWGPNHLPYPYRLVMAPQESAKANGFHMNNLGSTPITFYINYTIAYKVHVPTDPEIRVVKSLYWMDNYNVPGGSKRNSTYLRTRHATILEDAIIVTMNGHMHQGGKRLVASFEDASRAPHELCISYNLYKEKYPCFWDCKDICPYTNDWIAQWDTTTCYMELPVRKGEKIRLDAEYDNSCKWRGVMAWWFNFVWTSKTIGTKQ